MPSVVSEPHAAVACDQRGPTLNLVAAEGEGQRWAVAELAREHPDRVLREVRSLLRSEHLPLFVGPLRAPWPASADLRLGLAPYPVRCGRAAWAVVTNLL